MASIRIRSVSLSSASFSMSNFAARSPPMPPRATTAPLRISGRWSSRAGRMAAAAGGPIRTSDRTACSRTKEEESLNARESQSAPRGSPSLPKAAAAS
jgi:hypothetical protein